MSRTTILVDNSKGRREKAAVPELKGKEIRQPVGDDAGRERVISHFSSQSAGALACARAFGFSHCRSCGAVAFCRWPDIRRWSPALLLLRGGGGAIRDARAAALVTDALAVGGHPLRPSGR